MSAASRASGPALIPLAWPLFSELLLGIGVGLVGLALASRMSEAASGAFALANSVQATFFLLLRVVSLGVSVTITQELGAGNRALADATARAALGASTWVGLATVLAVASGARPLLTLLSAPGDVLPLATPYLQLLALALGVDAYNASMAAVMRAHLRARDVLLNILSMHALHLLLCWPLMRGVGPLPGLGLPGYALAMLASRGFGIACHLHLWRHRLALVPRLRDWWALERQRLRPVLQIGLPGAAEGLAYRLALMCTIAVVAHGHHGARNAGLRDAADLLHGAAGTVDRARDRNRRRAPGRCGPARLSPPPRTPQPGPRPLRLHRRRGGRGAHGPLDAHAVHRRRGDS